MFSNDYAQTINESLDLTTPSGKALAGMLAVFAEFEREILRERVRAGIAEARSKGKAHGRSRTAANKKDEVKKLHNKGLNNSPDCPAIEDRQEFGDSDFEGKTNCRRCETVIFRNNVPASPQLSNKRSLLWKLDFYVKVEHLF